MSQTKSVNPANPSREVVFSRRSFLASVVALGAAAAFGLNTGVAEAADVKWPVPTGALPNTIDGKEVLTCYAPSTNATFSEVLGLSNPSFYATEYNEYVKKGALSESPTLGIWGSSVNSQPNAFLSNLVYRDQVGGTVDEDVVAVLGSALQGASQFATADDEGVPLYMKHRPKIITLNATDSYNSKPLVDYVNIIKAHTEDSEFYREGDADYDPSFVDFRGYYGQKLGYMYSMWEVADAAEDILASDSTLTARYGAPTDNAALTEQFLVASQYAVLRAIDEGATSRKIVAVIGGVTNNNSGVINGVDLSSGRARIDAFDASTLQFDQSTAWGNTTNFNVRYYHASAALENCTDSIVDVLGYTEGELTSTDPIVKDSDGVLWARPEALMQCDALVVRTQTTVTTIPGTDELYQILREAGYTDEDAWPEIFTSNPTLGGYGASNCSQLFWWYAYLFFVYPEVINPVYMSAYLITKLYHAASSRLADAMDLLIGEMSLPEGVTLSTAGFNANDIDTTLAGGIEWYLSRKSEIDETYPNLEMTEHMATWLTAAKKAEMGINANYAAPVRIAGKDAYEAMANQILSEFDSAETIVIASADNWQHAVCATPLAALYGAPVVLAPKTLDEGGLPGCIEKLVSKLGAKRYIIVGGTSQISNATEDAFKALGLTARASRVSSGSSNAAMSLNVYKKGASKWGSTAIVATSSSSMSATPMAASAYAYAYKAPIFLTGKKMSKSMIKALKKFKKVIIVGNTSEVAKATAKQITNKSVTRWSGSTRYASALKIAKQGIAGNMKSNKAVFISGSKWQAALAAGCVAGKRKSVVLPVSSSTVSTAANYIAGKDPRKVYVFGDASAVSQSLYGKIQAALS